MSKTQKIFFFLALFFYRKGFEFYFIYTYKLQYSIIMNQGIMFHSTNRNTPDVDFKEAILRGQALDKGLYMLNEIPKLDTDQIYSFKDLELPEIGNVVISKIIGNPFSSNFLLNFCRYPP